MKYYLLVFGVWLNLNTVVIAQQNRCYDIFSFNPPAKYVLKEQQNRLLYERRDGNSFCVIQLWPVQEGGSDPQANFKSDWDHFAGNAYNIGDPKEKETTQVGDWQTVSGIGIAEQMGIQFIVSVSTFTQGNLSWCLVTQLNDEKFGADVDAFVSSIVADSKKFKGKITAGNNSNNKNNDQVSNTTVAVNAGITKYMTNFDDGWLATALTDYVQLKKGNAEVRLYYVDDALDNAKSNMIDAPEYYWSHYVAPYYNVVSPQKWSGVSYPVVYFMEGAATEKTSGRSCYVAIKIVYNGGANVILAVTADEGTLKQMFPHPNDMDRMLGYNKFAITEKDITGQWKAGTGGGIANYYSVYTGAYAYTTSLSTADDFAFNTDKTYHSEHYSASSGGAGTTYAALKYNGRYSATDWELNLTNRHNGNTEKYYAQFVAVKGGFLLQLVRSDYDVVKYYLFRAK